MFTTKYNTKLHRCVGMAHSLCKKTNNNSDDINNKYLGRAKAWPFSHCCVKMHGKLGMGDFIYYGAPG